MKCNLVNQNFRSDYVKNLMEARGVPDFNAFITYEDPEFTYKGLDNLEEGAWWLLKTIDKGEKILLIVDCDCDGYTSATIIYEYLRVLDYTDQITYLIHDGKQHGLEDHVEEILDSGEQYGLVIIPDAGSNDAKFCEELKDCCEHFLILDHHICEDEPNANMTIINNQASTNYQNKDLTGAGVVWRFCQHLDHILQENVANNLIDLAALGICGDMGSMLSAENQWFMRKGFSNINNYMFKVLVDKQSYSMNNEVTPMTVAFYIVPLINAMIRVGSHEEKVRLFEAFINGHKMIPSNKRGAKGTLEECAVESTRECTNAKSKQGKIKDAAIDRILTKIYKEDLLENKVLFIRLDEDDQFPAELNGLVAMGLSARFHRPTIVARLNDEGMIRGSARGLSNSELVSFRDFLNDSGLFEYNHGHDNAFGTSISNDSLYAFHKYANEALADFNFDEDIYEVNFDRFATEDDIYDIIDDVYKYHTIFGTGNPEPLIHISDINVSINDVQIMGSKKDTVKVVKNGIAYMKFHANDLIDDLKQYNEIKLEVIGRANMNFWNGYVTPQIFIENYAITDNTYGF